MSGESFWSVSDKPGDPEKVSGGFLVNRKGWKLFLLTLPGPRRPGKHVGSFSSFRKSWHLFVESLRASGKPSTNVFAESGFRKNAPETGAAFSGSPETCQKRQDHFGIRRSFTPREIQVLGTRKPPKYKVGGNPGKPKTRYNLPEQKIAARRRNCVRKRKPDPQGKTNRHNYPRPLGFFPMNGDISHSSGIIS
ncbi:MAG: hypothetical protein JWM68_1265 [Verrucomicrobiales bacterium]|nr:hypothetical protein [Verrucomicrobiales bacterium]